MSKYAFNSDIRIDVPEDVLFIINRLQENGYEAFAVGGCVRDVILGRKPKDWDITTSAKPMEIKSLFRRTIDTGLQHGTVTVMLNRVGYEVTTYRIDGEYKDNRHPESVEFTSNLIEDLKRRDFTINAMAYNPTLGLVDAFDGIGDIHRRVIKCVGVAKDRFSEDALRMLRAVRFSAQLGFEIEENTSQAIRELAPNLVDISKERICAEFEKTIVSGHPEKIRDAYSLGMTKWVLPEFDQMMECEQNNKYHMYTVGEHTIEVMKHVEAEHYIRWAALLHDVGKPKSKLTDRKGRDHFFDHGHIGKGIAEKIMRDLRLDNKTINIVTRLVACHDMVIDTELTPTSVRRSINVIGNDIFPLYIQLINADSEGKNEYAREQSRESLAYVAKEYERIIQSGECYCTKMLAVSGRDIIEIGLGPGEIVGEVLDGILQMVLANPELNTKEKLTEIIKQKWLQ